jgi:cell division septation protein DedD
MPGTTMPKHHGALSALALTALTALLALSGCSPRQPIPLDQPRLATKPPAEAPAPAKAPVAAKRAPAQVKITEKPAPTKTEPTKPALTQPELATVNLDTLTPEAPAAAGQTAPAERPAYVQVGAFGTAMNALGAVAWLKDKGYENSRMVRVEQGQGTLFRVQAGPFQDLASAHKALEALKPEWPQAFIPLD